MGRGRKTLLDEQGRKRCPKCDTYKELDRFGIDRGRAYDRSSWCLDCMNEMMKSKYTFAYHRNLHLIRTYNITSEQYDEMYKAQNGVCAICGQAETNRPGRTKRTKLEPALHVDHNHKTGVLRGLLCSECNHALGKMHDDPKRIVGLLDYLQKHSEPVQQLN